MESLPWALQKEILQARVYKLEAQLIAAEVSATAAADPWLRAADPWFRAAALLLPGRTAVTADPWIRHAAFLTATNAGAGAYESGKFGDPSVIAAAADDPADVADEKTVTAAAADEKTVIAAAADDRAAAADHQSHESDWDDEDRAAYAANAPSALARLGAATDPWYTYNAKRAYESGKFGNPAVTAAEADDPAAAADKNTVTAAAADEKTVIAAAANDAAAAADDLGDPKVIYDWYLRAVPSQLGGSAASFLQRELIIRDHELFVARRALDLMRERELIFTGHELLAASRALDLVRQVDATDLEMAAALVLLDPSMLGAQERGAIDWGHQILDARTQAAADDQARRAAVEMWV
jgi:deoxycytidylate deaminase